MLFCRSSRYIAVQGRIEMFDSASRRERKEMSDCAGLVGAQPDRK